MSSLVWVRRKTNMCEVCDRVMEVGEAYRARCKNCGLDFCRNCYGAQGICSACAKSSLFQCGVSPAQG